MDEKLKAKLMQIKAMVEECLAGYDSEESDEEESEMEMEEGEESPSPKSDDKKKIIAAMLKRKYQE